MAQRSLVSTRLAGLEAAFARARAFDQPVGFHCGGSGAKAGKAFAIDRLLSFGGHPGSQTPAAQPSTTEPYSLSIEAGKREVHWRLAANDGRSEFWQIARTEGDFRAKLSRQGVSANLICAKMRPERAETIRDRKLPRRYLSREARTFLGAKDDKGNVLQAAFTISFEAGAQFGPETTELLPNEPGGFEGEPQVSAKFKGSIAREGGLLTVSVKETATGAQVAEFVVANSAPSFEFRFMESTFHGVSVACK